MVMQNLESTVVLKLISHKTQNLLETKETILNTGKILKYEKLFWALYYFPKHLTQISILL